MSEYRNIRSTPLYATLVCGAIIIIVGLYYLISNQALHGLTLPGGRGSSRTWEPVTIDGLGLILVGLVVCFYPAYILYKKGRQQEDK
ncbi:hypothetical protein [Paracnuella aquatica]|uniref:hypothetical protein n=1 Tax=Paracnuella aquatica TaxID=2268757 RepID=UPI000F4E0BEF|nr:hypothetical protein [Paracnuella aquatica]RPD43553.1 hypothetical protein DRJ53_19635 [Paracnuella aquatica]